MAQVAVNQIVAAPLDKVWESWDDFANIAQFNPVVQRSFLTDERKSTGLGAKRQCDLADGKNYIREEIVGYQTQEYLEIDIYEGTMPLKEARAIIRLDRVSADRTRVSMTMRFTPKLGLIGQAMLPVMKRQFKSMIRQLPEGNAKYVEEKRAAVAA